MKKLIPMLVAAILLAGLSSFSYEGELNVVDASGKRQGHWLITAAMAKQHTTNPARVVQEGAYVDSKRTGGWTTYDDDGTIRNKINYVNDRPDGMALYYAPDGKLVCEVPFIDGVRSGTGKFYYPDGNVKMEMTWTNGRIDGPAKTFSPHGKVCEKGTWRHNYWVH
jgi:antitoxin component YwqK of YwqJK toxin-antitoxin module